MFDLSKQAELWILKADTASYKAKNSGGNTVVAGSDGAYSRWQLLEEFKVGIGKQQFVLHYQPVICLRTLEVAGYEALVRWKHPQRGLLYPDSFIELVEQSGYDHLLSAEVFRLAAAKQKELLSKNIKRWISVNVSPDTLTHEEFGNLAKSVEGLHIHVEITERKLLTIEGEIEIAGLRAQGNEVLLDDFGTGQSRFTNLLDIDAIKLDRSLVEQGGRVCRAIVKMAQEMGLACVAEGIETKEQSLEMQKLGCEYGQGYYFAKPGPLNA